MGLTVNLLIISLASIVLIKAVSWFIESSSKIAHHFNISNYTISFLLVAIATSLPEVVVGITSAMNKTPILSFGNAIGSNIALLTLVIAIPILISSSISTRTLLHTKDIYFAMLFSVLPLLLIIDGVLTRVDGGILLILYVLYFAAVLRRGRGLEKLMHEFENVNVWKQGVIFIMSLAILLGASEVIVRSATSLSGQVGLTLGFIGLSITAIGTSLPEIAFAIGAVKKHHQFEILGNVTGSVVANSAAVLGITSLITPIKITDSDIGISSLLFLIFSTLLFFRFVKTKEKLDKVEAVILLATYILFIATEFYLQS